MFILFLSISKLDLPSLAPYANLDVKTATLPKDLIIQLTQNFQLQQAPPSVAQRI
jgi:hypothetical protein